MNESIVTPRSYCPQCKSTIPFYRNIPLLSFILQKGKCTVCRTQISFQYPIVEFISGFFWYWGFSHYAISEAFLFVWISSLLLVISMIDHRTFIIPLSLVILSIIGLLLYNFFHPDEIMNTLKGSIVGLSYIGTVFLITSYIFKKQTLGLGDLQLIVILGGWIGPWNVILMIFLASMFALISWVGISLNNGFNRNTPLPFGPYLSGASILIYMSGLEFSDFLLIN